MKALSRLRFESGNQTMGFWLWVWFSGQLPAWKCMSLALWGGWVPASPLSTGPFKHMVEGVRIDSNWEYLMREERGNQTAILTAFCFQSFSLPFPFSQVPPRSPSAPKHNPYIFFLKFLFIYFHWMKQFAFGPFLLGSFSPEICIFLETYKIIYSIYK